MGVVMQYRYPESGDIETMEPDFEMLGKLSEGFCPYHDKQPLLITDDGWGKCLLADVDFRLSSTD